MDDEINNITECLCRICLGDGASIPIFEDSGNEDSSNFSVQNKLSLCLNDELEDVAGHPRYICDHCQETLDTVFDFINKYKETCRILQEGIIVVVKQENDENYEDNDRVFYYPAFATFEQNSGDFTYCEIFEQNPEDFTFETLEKNPLDLTFETFEQNPGDVTFETFEPNQKKKKIEFDKNKIYSKKTNLKTSENKKLKKGTPINKDSEGKPDISTKAKPFCKLKTYEKNEISKKEQHITNIRNNWFTYKTNRVASSLLEGEFVWNGEDWRPRIGVSKELVYKKDPVEGDKIDLQNQPKAGKRPPEPVLCGCCGKKFFSHNKLRFHEKTMRKRCVMVRCPVCNVHISSQGLNKHIKTLHPNVKKKMNRKKTHFKNGKNKEVQKGTPI